MHRFAWYPFALALLVTACGDVGLGEMKSALRTVLVQTGDSTLTAYYDARDFNPRWTQRDHPNAVADSLLRALCRADAHGLDPARYDVARLSALYQTAYQQDEVPDSARAVALATLDVALSQALLGYARDLYTGSAFPLDTARTRWTPQDSLSALQKETPSDLRKSLTLPHEGYAALRDALDRYRALADSGGWRPLTRTLEPGATGPAVLTLRRRLAATGDLDGEETGATYDAAVAEAVGRFQRRHGLPPSGVVDEATRQALSVPVETRVRQVQVALERRRWLPVAPGDAYLVANTGDGHLYGFRDGVAALRLPMTTDPACKRPAFVADSVTAVTFSPGGGARLSLGSAALSVAATVEGDAGCFRVRMPAVLVPFVLDGTDRWNEARVREALAAPETRTAALARPLPFYALPRSAWIEDGVLQFRDEMPEDRALARTLRTQNPRQTEQACRVLTAPR